GNGENCRYERGKDRRARRSVPWEPTGVAFSPHHFMKSIHSFLTVVAAALLCAQAASPSPASWASSEIARVTDAGVLGHSAATFRPQAPLTERALATAIAATDKLLHPPAP